MIITLSIIALLVLGIFLFMQQAVFGVNPEGRRQARIEKSSHYKDGAFQNLSPTEVTAKNASMVKMMGSFLNKPKTTEPQKTLPSVQTNLNTLADDKPSIVWFGHSSYLIKSKGKTVLVDPVFSGHASPVSFFAKAFKGTNGYGVKDMPAIDVLVITHDHYDHLDYETILTLAPKVKKIYTSLGVGAHLEHWGIPADKIVEFDWWETQKVSDSITLTATPARHFSGRSFTRGKTLWSSFVLNIDGYNIFIGGDSGYDTHFKTIGDKYGPFDIALLEAGQYGVNWPYIHMLPEETVMAAKDLQAKILQPVHWGKFALALHDWNEPIQRVVESAHKNNVKITTPLIGEAVVLDSIYPNKEWWK
ncbi:MAG: fold metallo-hydrolase [Chitinophagaceae bacterium]|nr:fold metallo-hydrolase [Chitinophagaceae bacterium]